jgi:uncharacterized membrane protein
MNTKKILIAGLVGGIAAFFLGWLLFGILLKDMGPDPLPGFMREDADFVMWAMVLSNLFFGILLAYIYVQWANIATWITGAKAGAILGFLIGASYDLSYFAMSNVFTLSSMITDILLTTVWTALIGAIIGWWLSRGTK